MKKIMPWTLATSILASGLMLSSPAQADEYHYNENYELIHNETGKVTAVSNVDGYLNFILMNMSVNFYVKTATCIQVFIKKIGIQKDSLD
ncbi:hypothetical protein [Kurthia massiliensis]|uniref:hypothetical protein n=1 Tax=Kurthia massiliensis TaxID=1033739 RepID=UPI000289CEDA|nr:hypothetical protein [Kurthia massiliensis]